MESSKCQKCGDVPEDILMLACNHDLCLPCASACHSRSKKSKGIQCQFCNGFTQLDEDTISQLLRVRNRYSREPTTPSSSAVNRNPVAPDPPRSYKTSSTVPMKGDSMLPNFGQSKQPPRAAATKTNCVNHPQQDLLYYCFNCHCPPICPQCVIHGQHKQHEVMTIRKSTPRISNALEECMATLREKGKQAIASREDYERKSAQANDLAKHTKKTIQQGFESLRAKLLMKEKELLQKCDRVLEGVLEGYRASFETVQRQYNQVEREVRNIQAALRFDPIRLLEHYSKTKSSLEQQAKQALPVFHGDDSSPYLGSQQFVNKVSECAEGIEELNFGEGLPQGMNTSMQKAGGREIKEREYNRGIR